MSTNPVLLYNNLSQLVFGDIRSTVNIGGTGSPNLAAIIIRPSPSTFVGFDATGAIALYGYSELGLPQVANKVTTSIADNVATAVLTVTIPNVASPQNNVLRVSLVSELGGGGAIGSGESTGVVAYDFAIVRLAGGTAVIGASSAYGAASAVSAGAATITTTAAASAVSGGATATQTFTVNVTIHAGSGGSTNHVCDVTATLLAPNLGAITLS